MEKLARGLGIENLSHSQVSEVTKGLNEQVREFRSRSLAASRCPVLLAGIRPENPCVMD
jgi:transposase-like protein